MLNVFHSSSQNLQDRLTGLITGGIWRMLAGIQLSLNFYTIKLDKVEIQKLLKLIWTFLKVNEWNMGDNP